MSDIKLPFVVTSEHPEFPVLAWSPLEIAAINRLMREAVRLNAQADIRALIADDAYAMTFQSLGQYRSALLAALSAAPAAPQPAQQPLTDEQCDAVYTALDAWARKADAYEFGLPRAYGGGAKGGREIIRNAISGVKNG